MSLRIDFSEIAATQFFLLPHDVYATIRAELVSRLLGGREEAEPGPQLLRLTRGGELYEVKYELTPEQQHVRVLNILKTRAPSQSAA